MKIELREASGVPVSGMKEAFLFHRTNKNEIESWRSHKIHVQWHQKVPTMIGQIPKLPTSDSQRVDASLRIPTALSGDLNT